MNQDNFRFVRAVLCPEGMLTLLLLLALQVLGWSQTDPCAGVPLNVGCIANVNVTLNANCQANITPSMVLTGNYSCADEIQITVDGGNSNQISGCGDHTYVVVVIENGAQVYTCWGNIFAEDKTDPTLVCPADTDEVTVDVEAQLITGTLAVTDAGMALANYSCFLEVFPPQAGNHYYDLFTFTVNNPGGQAIFTFDMGSAWGDGSMALFQGSFNPANPCENMIAQADDLINGNGFFASFDPTIRLTSGLTHGQTYTLLVSSWTSNQTGNYSVAVYGENGSLNGGFPSVSAPVTFDLVCTDIDQIRLLVPTTYVVSATGTILSITPALRRILELTGFPQVGDNCGDVLVRVTDAVSSAGNCGNVTITRTFRVTDRYNSSCVGTPRARECQQRITFRKPVLSEVILPNFTAVVECDENFPTDGSVGGPDNNPAAGATGYPFIRTAFGFHDINDDYCNLGATYSDKPRITVCEGSYKLRREWTVIDWCNPTSSIIYNQIIKVGDYTGPVLSGIPAVIQRSTSPFNCLANVVIPIPQLTDGNGCSSVHTTTYTILANGTTFYRGGNIAPNTVVPTPIGTHQLILCAEDDCGNETCETYTLVVRDLIEPTASCDDQLNVSIGGGDVANGIQGISRIFAVDVNEGSNDNCGEVTLEVRRNYWRNNTCDPSANRWSAWGPFVDFYCCDIANAITIELRVTDESGNVNVCWMTVTPEDKLNPYCYAPANVSLTCAALPLAFPGDLENAYDDDFAATSLMMDALFGAARGTDNCRVDTIVERTPNIQINECGWGSITRRFEAWQVRPAGDVNGNGAIDINEVFRSTNSCSQLIEITEVHDFVIDFPEDTDADCGDPEIPTIITEADGCDVLSVNIGNPVRFSSVGDECYKVSITYDVINWCLWDGEYTGYVLPRMTEDDGEPLPVDRSVEGNERPVVRYSDSAFCIDRRHNDRDGDSSLDNCFSPNLPNYGRYRYTQFIKVYDSTSPVVTVGEYGGPTAQCPNLEAGQFGSFTSACEAFVSIPFSVNDDCELFNQNGQLVISIVSAHVDLFAVDANRDGSIKSNEFVIDANAAANITSNGDGTYVFSGNFPIITSAMGDNIYHAFRVLFQDGCGNQVSEYIEFQVVDCKAPAPICINGLTVTLMPQENGGCAMAIWASDFEASPVYDCTGQGPAVHPQSGLPRVTKYAIYRASDVAGNPNFVPSPNDTGLVLTDEDEETTIVYVYTFDEEGNYDYCETYVLVQQHANCTPSGTGTIHGIIMTTDDEPIQGVEVNVNGNMGQMVTNANGTYSFVLPQGGDYSITPYLNANPLNGVSTFDLVLMVKHILGVQPFDTPYKYIAADVNNSRTVTTLDMIQLRKLILNIETQFQNNTSWRFVDASYNFPVPTNPWLQVFPELINENNLIGNIPNTDFVGVKIGDVNGSARANALAGDDRTVNGTFNFVVADEQLKAGNTYTLAFRGDMADIEGFQSTLQLNGAALVDIEEGTVSVENFGLRYADQGLLIMSWNKPSFTLAADQATEEVLFSLVIRATKDTPLSEVIRVNNRYATAEAYRNNEVYDLGIVFTNVAVAAVGFEMYQNTPNPFESETRIGFSLPEDAEATLTIADINGRVLTVIRADYPAGYNSILVDKTMLKTEVSGVLTYTIETANYKASRQMVVVKK